MINTIELKDKRIAVCYFAFLSMMIAFATLFITAVGGVILLVLFGALNGLLLANAYEMM